MSKIPVHDKFELLLVSSIKENPDNPRRRTAREHALLDNGIQEFGFVVPVTVDEHNVLLAGHARLASARRHGMTHITGIRLIGLSEAKKRAFMVFDNKIVERGSFDEKILRGLFEKLTGEDLDFDVIAATGFDAAEFEAVLHLDDFGEQEPDPADAVAPPVPARVAKLGDIFLIGPHRHGCGDALDTSSYAALLQGQRAQACITDSPYNVPVIGHVSGKGKARHREFAQAFGEMSEDQFIAFLERAFANIIAHLKSGGLLYAFMDGAHLYELMCAARRLGLEQKALVTWAKVNAGMGGLYRQQTEHIGVFKAGKGASLNNVKLGRYGRNRTTLWTYPGQNSFGRGRDKALAIHPTTKPVAMLADAILDCTQRGDIVLDPFAGSASTLIAAHRTGRVGVGLELDPLYVDAALARLKAVTGFEPVRESDGATWSELVAQAGAAQ